MKRIPLTKGFFALVDDGDFDSLSQFKWHVRETGQRRYAIRRQYGGSPQWIRMHRQIVTALPDEEVDHLNGDGLDNRRKNLRNCSHRENCRAFKSKTQQTSSQFRGVTWHAKAQKWAAQVKMNGRCFYVGLFEGERAAAVARDAKAVELFGSFAGLNFPVNKNKQTKN